MSQLKIWLIASVVLLVTSNAMWASRVSLENEPKAAPSYGCTESEQYGEILEELVQPLAAAVNASTRPGATKESILAAAADPSTDNLTCVTPADTRIGTFGLQFAGERLTGVSTLVCIPHRP